MDHEWRGPQVVSAQASQSQLQSQLASPPPAPPSPPKPTNPRGKRQVSDHEHTAALVISDFIAALLAVPVALLLLAGFSDVAGNSLHHFAYNIEHLLLYPCTIVIALAASGSYRSARRALQPSTFTEIKDLVMAIFAGGILFLALGALGHFAVGTNEFVVSQLLMAVVVQRASSWCSSGP